MRSAKIPVGDAPPRYCIVSIHPNTSDGVPPIIHRTSHLREAPPHPSNGTEIIFGLTFRPQHTDKGRHQGGRIPAHLGRGRRGLAPLPCCSLLAISEP
ncbi:hypothetical protein THAOC_16190 [Thalassiosira oceanica]|uniref:Uncharacterized protein n=1 Tax=Thalassiosira oceanica TaxID=159749 RepID=K0SAQ0_THAOC|nr:hypothetical protein THAOC_16190 [Thalassiosira oceanica]|eukprot:EJK63168.1 hypothetical protein THAOC_16190 [Thalassiosira oceanica]